MQPETLSHLKEAWDRRAALRGLDAYRLFSGAKEGIEGLIADRYGDVVILQVHAPEQDWKPVAEWYLENAAASSVYLKHFVADRSHSKATDALYSAEPFAGTPAPAELEIVENGLKLLVKPYDGFSTGIFLDQRDNRAFVRERASGKRVLNLFSYTCAFSLAAAVGGGTVTSIDVSPKYLEWGRRNFSVNDIESREHRFLVEDAVTFLKKEAKRGHRYELIVIDPPSFGRDRRGNAFSLKRDLGTLLAGGFSVLEPGGELFFSCNFSEWDTDFLRKAAQKEKRGVSFLPVPALPKDFQWEAAPISYFLAT